MTSSCDISSNSKSSNAANSKTTNDLSIRIDPRESLAYQTLDEHFQVVDSEHTKQQTPLSYNSKLSSPKFRTESKSPSLQLKTKYNAPFFK